MDALEQLNLAAPIAEIYSEVEVALINHIARQLTANPDTLINATSEWRLQMLARMGRLNRETSKIIASKVKKVPDEVERAVNASIASVLKEHKLDMTDELSGNIRKALQNYDRQAVKDKYNQVNTVMQYKAKQAYKNGVNAVADRFERIQQKALANSQEYLDILNKQAMAVTLGETTRTQAVRETIREMSEKGIPAFVDAAGREWSPEAYVNMDIRNTVKNAALAAEFASLDELGQDVILVSSHAGARPKCAPYQGKFFSRSGKSGTIKDARGKEYTYTPLSDTSFGEPDGLFGINCGHRMRGVSEGLFINREKQYSEDENSEEYKKVCKQRQMERKIRTDKHTKQALEAAGDIEGVKDIQKKITAENKQLRAYCEQEGLTYRQDRTQIYGYSDTSRKKKPVDFIETVDKSAESGIMKSKDVKELEQAKKRDHKIYVTDVAIDKVDKVSLSDFSEEQISAMQRKHKELLRIAKEENDSNEVLLINDLGFKSEVSVLGGEFKVSPGENPFAVSVISNAKRQSLIYLHNHPSTNNFSVGDIDTFVCESAIKTMSVVTNQGEVYVLNKTAAYNYNNIRALLNEIYKSFDGDEIDNKAFVSEFLKRCKEGGVEYGKAK